MNLSYPFVREALDDATKLTIRDYLFNILLHFFFNISF